TYFVAPQGNSLLIWAFGQPSHPGERPPLLSTSVTTSTPLSGIEGSVVLRSGMLHVALATGKGCPPAPQPCASRVRVLRVPVKQLTTGGTSALSASTNPADGYLDYDFGHGG